MARRTYTIALSGRRGVAKALSLNLLFGKLCGDLELRRVRFL